MVGSSHVISITERNLGGAGGSAKREGPEVLNLHLSSSAGGNVTSNKTKQGPREFELREVKIKWVRLR